MKILLCAPRGFCAGVVRAIETVEKPTGTYTRAKIITVKEINALLNVSEEGKK